MPMDTQNLDMNLTLGSDYWPSSPDVNFMYAGPVTTPPASLSNPTPVSPPPVPPGTGAVEAVEAAEAAEAAEPARHSARPLRAAKRRAIERIRGIQHWERCSESSELFRRVERRFNEELNNEILSREEREELERHPESLDAQEQTHDDEMGSEMSEDESPTASLRDFIVTDDEDVPDDESFHTCSEIDSEAHTEEETASEHAEEDCENEEGETLPY